MESRRSSIKTYFPADLGFEISCSSLFDPIALSVCWVAETSYLIFNSYLVLVLYYYLTVHRLSYKLFAGHTLGCKQSNVRVFVWVDHIEPIWRWIENTVRHLLFDVRTCPDIWLWHFTNQGQVGCGVCKIIVSHILPWCWTFLRCDPKGWPFCCRAKSTKFDPLWCCELPILLNFS
jgi:hypothetical protein